MGVDGAQLGVIGVIAALIALPAVQVWWRRRVSRAATAVAAEVAEYARTLRGTEHAAPPDASLEARAQSLGLAEWTSVQMAQQLPNASPQLLADAADRFALRVRRRVAFERKMLARTASGRRRGAVAAAVPGILLVILGATGVEISAPALAVLAGLEVAGCWLLLRAARVEI